MHKTWLILLIAGVIVVALFMLTAVAAFLFLPIIGDAMAQPQGPVLVYEVDPDSLAPGRTVDMNKLMRAMNRRLNPGWNKLARLRILDDQRIEVAVMGKSEADVRRVEISLAHNGNLEFRTLANRHDDKSLIDKTLADPSKTKIQNKDGTLVAWWVAVKPGQESSLTGSDIAIRKTTKAGRQITEVLVLNDEYNVTGAYLTRVNAGVDTQGKPCINFAFNSLGGQLFGELTETHLPDSISGFSYRLAIIFDDEVYSAPSIRSRICENGQITGSFTMDEVEEIVSALNAGTLPARIRPVRSGTVNQ
jgi:preprotein translocase subunit SecD